jgi:alpha-ketoglutarate-dependent taurine dioxygenase
MKTSLHENGWATYVDANIKDLSKDEAHTIAKMIYKQHVVVFKNQHLSQEEELTFCKMIGEINNVYGYNEQSNHISYENGIIRVTGEKNDHGKKGLFGHKEVLDWHTHQPSTATRYPFIWMYTVKGSSGSRTSWMNLKLAYEDLSQDIKEQIEDIKVICGFEKGRFSTTEFFKEFIARERPIKIVQKDRFGNRGLYFPFLQIFDVVDDVISKPHWELLYEKLINHVTQEKYIFHHDWNDNEVIISEQWHTLHKRWEFDNIENRMLHRIAFDDTKVNFDES